jgi:uncharacterized protein (TIGR03083 family)
MSSSPLFPLIAAERRRLADLASTWSPEQWDTPALPDGWRVREVLAHLTMPFEVSTPALLVGLARHRGSYDRFADTWARQTAGDHPPEHFIETVRHNADSTFTPPGMGAAAPLTDLIVHGLDVRIPLGLTTTDFDPQALAAVLAFLTTRPARRFGVPVDAFERSRLEATDLDWAHGTGPPRRAPAADLIAHLCRAQPLT